MAESLADWMQRRERVTTPYHAPPVPDPRGGRHVAPVSTHDSARGEVAP
jgi:hypothetical protein